MKSIAVYCSSSNKVDDIYKEEAEKVGNLIAQMGIKLIYGGGNMGLMGILSNSAINSGGEVYGVITNHLIEIEKRNESLNNIKIVKTMHERKIEMYNNADAFLIFRDQIHCPLQHHNNNRLEGEVHHLPILAASHQD